MREIDPIRNPSEALLSAALHRLASGSPQNAPAELGAELAQAFRHHHRRRKQVRTMAMAALAACLALVMVLLQVLKPGTQHAPAVAHQAAPAVTPNPGTPRTPGTTRQDQQPKSARLAAQTAASRGNETGFMALDTYDPAITAGDLQVVRLELSGADLRLIGAPVAEDLADHRLLADIVVGSDGTPYAVRLVR